MDFFSNSKFPPRLPRSVVSPICNILQNLAFYNNWLTQKLHLLCRKRVTLSSCIGGQRKKIILCKGSPQALDWSKCHEKKMLLDIFIRKISCWASISNSQQQCLTLTLMSLKFFEKWLHSRVESKIWTIKKKIYGIEDVYWIYRVTQIKIRYFKWLYL